MTPPLETHRSMRYLLPLLLLLPLSSRAAEPSWATNDRIVIYGDSITGASKYNHYWMAYTHLRNPTKNLHIYSIGQGGTNIPNWVADSNNTNTSYQYFNKLMAPLLGGAGAGPNKYSYSKFGYNGAQTDSEFQTNYESLITNNILTIGAIPGIIGPQPKSTANGDTQIQARAARGVTVAMNGSYAYSDNFNALLALYTDSRIFTAATSDVCTSVGHGFVDGTKVTLTLSSSPPSGLSSSAYFVRDSTADTFKLATTSGGTAVDITSTGSGIHRAARNYATNADDTLTNNGHGFADGTRVLVDVAAAQGALVDGIYYVRDSTTNTFKLATTPGGTAVDVSVSGTGTHRVSRNQAELQYPGTQGTPEIHHSTTGHYIDFYTIIQQLGWGNDVSSATINYNGGSPSTTASDHCTIGSLTANSYDGVDFTRLDARLPMAPDEEDGRTRSESQRMVPAMNGWQLYILDVDNLPSGTFDIYINGSVVTSLSNTALAAGWNMSELTVGPVYTKAHNVLDLIRDQQGISRTTLTATGPPNTGMINWESRAGTRYAAGDRGQTLIDNLVTYQAQLDVFDAAIWAAAQPATLTFSLRRQGAGTVTTTPRTSNLRRAGRSSGGTGP